MSDEKEDRCRICLEGASIAEYPNVFRICQCSSLIHKRCFELQMYWKYDLECNICECSYVIHAYGIISRTEIVKNIEAEMTKDKAKYGTFARIPRSRNIQDEEGFDSEVCWCFHEDNRNFIKGLSMCCILLCFMLLCVFFYFYFY